MTSLDLAVEQRKQHRQKITRMHNARENYAEYSDMQKRQTLMKLESIQKDLEMINDKIFQIKFNGSTVGVQEEMGKCEEYNDKLIECRCLLNTLHPPLPPSHQAAGTGAGAQGGIPRSLLKSPTAP